MDGRDVDHGGTRRGPKQGQQAVDELHRGSDVDVPDTVKPCHVHRSDRDRFLEAGIVDKDIQPRIGRNDRLRQRSRTIRRAEVGCDEGAAQFGRQLLRLVSPSPMDPDPGASSGEPSGEFSADAADATGNEGDLSIKPEGCLRRIAESHVRALG